MPLLNPPDILPEAMRFLLRALMTAPGRQLGRDELVGLVAPSGLVEAFDSLGALDVLDETQTDAELRTGGAQIAKASLGALRSLGLVNYSGDSVLLVGLDDWKTYERASATAVSEILLRAFIEKAKSDSESAATSVGDLRDALSVLYAAPDPLWPVTTFEAGPAGRRAFSEEEKRWFDPDDRTTWPIPNREQFTTFVRLAPYLGLARTVSGGGIVADASLALDTLLSIEAPAEFGISEFVAQCSSALPLLDGGAIDVRHEAEESGDHAVLSPVVSLTLLQLEAKGLLTLNRLSDVGLRTIRTSSGGTHDRAVSHVAWTRASKSKGRRT